MNSMYRYIFRYIDQYLGRPLNILLKTTGLRLTRTQDLKLGTEKQSTHQIFKPAKFLPPQAPFYCRAKAFRTHSCTRCPAAYSLLNTEWSINDFSVTSVRRQMAAELSRPMAALRTLTSGETVTESTERT